MPTTTAPATPTTSRKRGRPRDPGKLARILDALRGDPLLFLEYGPPPYNVADIAERLEMDASNLRAYLLALERDGLVIRERRAVECWNGIARGHVPRLVWCFWNAATMEQDRAATDTWNAGTSDRAAGACAAFDRMFAPSDPSATAGRTAPCQVDRPPHLLRLGRKTQDRRKKSPMCCVMRCNQTRHSDVPTNRAGLELARVVWGWVTCSNKETKKRTNKRTLPGHLHRSASRGCMVL